MRTFRHLNLSKRETLERMLKENYSVSAIAKCLEVAVSTVYLEIKRGSCEQLTSDLEKVTRYSADFAHYKYLCNLKKKGQTPKILLDDKLKAYIKYLIKSQKYSPQAVMLIMKKNEVVFTHNVSSYTTVYTAIKRGYIKGLKVSDLPRGKYKKKLPKDRSYKQKPYGTSIELRDPEILTRKEFGHWEMDSVVGQITNKKTALVLTERKTRYEIIEKMRAHTTEEVMKALNRVEKRYGSAFYRIFKTITVDNGSEFSDSEGIEKALYRVGKRTKMYYCHPNSPNERGSNENCNLLVRRFLPKGTDFDQELTTTKVKHIEDWINTYPRPLHGGNCAEDLFIEELSNIGIEYYYRC